MADNQTTTLARRSVLASGLALFSLTPALAAAQPLAPPGGRLDFDVYRNGKKIGEHHIAFAGQGEELTARIDAEMRVGLGPVTVFHYRHQGVETWRDGRFVSLATHSDSNGDKVRLVAERSAQGVRVESSKLKAAYVAPPDAAPLTHWNAASLERPLFNPQDGKMLKVAVARRGLGPITLDSGRQVQAARMSLTGDANIDDWYDAANCWTALRGRVSDGSTLEYRRL